MQVCLVSVRLCGRPSLAALMCFPMSGDTKFECPNASFDLVGDRCLLVSGTRPEVGWDDAHAACRAIDGSVASIPGTQQQEYATQKCAQMETPMWIGTRYTYARYGTWSNGELVLYKNWGTNEPAHINTVGNGCALLLNDTHGTWVSRDCSEHHAYLCERQPVEIAATTSTEEHMLINSSQATTETTKISSQTKTIATTFGTEQPNPVQSNTQTFSAEVTHEAEQTSTTGITTGEIHQGSSAEVGTGKVNESSATGTAAATGTGHVGITTPPELKQTANAADANLAFGAGDSAAVNISQDDANAGIQSEYSGFIKAFQDVASTSMDSAEENVTPPYSTSLVRLDTTSNEVSEKSPILTLLNQQGEVASPLKLEDQSISREEGMTKNGATDRITSEQNGSPMEPPVKTSLCSGKKHLLDCRPSAITIAAVLRYAKHFHMCDLEFDPSRS